MDPRKMDLNLLKVVTAIAQTGSLSAAATELHVTPPAVSNSLARLRRISGDQIFIRSREGQVPTAFGKVLVSTSKQVLAEVEGCFRDHTNFDPQTTARKFEIALDEGIQMTLLPKILFRLQRLPNIELNVHNIAHETAVQALELGNIDLLLSANPHQPTRIHTETVMYDEAKIVLRRGHPLAQKKRLTMQDFHELGFVIVRPNIADFQAPQLLLQKMGIKRRIAFEAAESNILPAIVAATDYAATVPIHLWAQLINLYDLCTFDLPFQFPKLDIFMGIIADQKRDPAVVWLAEEIKGAIAAFKP